MPRIEVWTVNLGRGVSDEKFRLAVRSVLRSADRSRAAILFQEIDEADGPDEHAILAREAFKSYRPNGWTTAVPILTSRRRFKVTGTRTTFASKGLAKVTPHRVIEEVVTRLIDRDSGATRLDFPAIVFLNTHMALARPTTRTRRAIHRTRLTARVASHRARGRIVIYGLDSNTHGHWKRLVPGERMLVEGGPGGIDKIVLILPRDVIARVAERRRAELGIDGHDGLGVVLDLYLKDRP